MQDGWYYKTRSGVVGPLTDDELASALREGALTVDSLVRHGIGGRFQPLGEALAHPSDEMRGSTVVASELLAKMDRVVVTGGPTGTTGISVWESLVDAMGAFAALLLWPFAATWNWLRTYIGRKTMAVLLLGIAGVFVLRMIPALDPPLGQTHRELSAIWEETRSITREPVDKAALAAFSQKTLPRLDGIAEMLERSHERRLGYNIWALVRGRNDATEKARLDLLRIAKYDLPALLRSPEKAGLRGPLIEKQLNRVDEHLAAAGKSPYVTPEPFKRVAEESIAPPPDGAASGDWDSPWIVAVMMVDAVLIIGGATFWWRRRRQATA